MSPRSTFQSCGISSTWRAAQESPDPGHAVVADRGPLRAVGLGVGAHRAQLEDLEAVAELPEPALAVEDRPAVVELDRDRRDREHGQEAERDDAAEHEVEGALGVRPRGAEPRVHDVAVPGGVDHPDRNVAEDLLVELVGGDQADRQVEAVVGDPRADVLAAALGGSPASGPQTIRSMRSPITSARSRSSVPSQRIRRYSAGPRGLIQPTTS